MTRLANFLINASLTIVSIALTAALVLAGVELYLRSKFGSEPTSTLRDMVQFHDERGWELKPGRYRHFDAGAMTASNVAINELGLRGEHAPLQASPARERVTLVGDSMMFALALDDSETIPARLQATAGERYEIVNVSAPGFGTGQQILLLEHLRAKGYDWGSRVILAFFTNDIQDNLGLDYSTLARQTHRPAFSVADGEKLAIQPPVKPAVRAEASGQPENRYLFDDFIASQAELLVARFPILLTVAGAVTGGVKLPREPGIISGWYSPGWEDRWRVTSDLIEYLAATVAARPGARLEIVYIPSPVQVEPAFKQIIAGHAPADRNYASFLQDIDRPQRVLLELCGRKHLRCVDPTERLRAASEQGPTYFLREGHLNPHGVDVVTQAFKELLQDR